MDMRIPVIATLALLLSLPASAMEPPKTAVQAQAVASTAAAVEDDARQINCLRHTGSRILPRASHRQARTNAKPAAETTGFDRMRDCVPAAGRSYGRADLERTGAIDLAEALRRLDPSIH